MGFSIGEIFKAALLLLNALAILSERRLLEPWGLTVTAASIGDGGAKAQLASVLSSIRTLLRWPLIILNVVTTAFALVFG